MSSKLNKESNASSTKPSNVYPIRAVERVCDILDALQDARQGASLPDISAITALPKSSAFRYLSALEARQYVERDEDTALYRVGLAFQPHNTRQLEAVLAVAEGPLQRLSHDTGETANLGTLEGSMVRHNLVIESKQMMRLAARVGERGPIHSTALGKAMAAELPEERLLNILTSIEMPRFTEATITTPQHYQEALVAVREDGFALDDCENQTDGRCVAVVLQGMPFSCAISVSAPAQRFGLDDVPKVVEQLRQAASQIVRDFQT
jgi:IclR family acetate operon transcriptional repressor